MITAMETCGALYVKTRVAIDFIDSNLAKARDELVVEFVRVFRPVHCLATDCQVGEGSLVERMAVPDRPCPRS